MPGSCFSGFLHGWPFPFLQTQVKCHILSKAFLSVEGYTPPHPNDSIIKLNLNASRLHMHSNSCSPHHSLLLNQLLHSFVIFDLPLPCNYGYFLHNSASLFQVHTTLSFFLASVSLPRAVLCSMVATSFIWLLSLGMCG